MPVAKRTTIRTAIASKDYRCDGCSVTICRRDRYSKARCPTSLGDYITKRFCLVHTWRDIRDAERRRGKSAKMTNDEMEKVISDVIVRAAPEIMFRLRDWEIEHICIAIRRLVKRLLKGQKP